MDYDDDLDPPWWRTTLRAIGMLVGMLVMATAVMAGIVGVARFFDSGDKRIVPVYIDASSPPPPPDNAMTRETSPYGPVPWPDHPGRPPAVSFKGRAVGGNRGAGPAAPPAKPAEPVGLSMNDYRAAVDSGKKLYIPNPQGECDLSGQNSSKSAAGLENCFAQRVAR